jgi:cellulose synthase/poly-beta-1,6-N-acetylglucosamine synthase-like glycosyltransferase
VRFDVIVPAHDEEHGITDTVRSLLAVDYPADLRRVFVVADNCTDGTAARGDAAGASVLVRTDPARRGKGHALAFAFAHSLADGFADAVVAVDADAVVTPNLLSAFAARLARGDQAVQARSAVRNVAESWRTQLMQLGLALFNDLRSLGRENLGLSCGLRGNGMCLRTSLLRAQPWNAFSIVEDVEYGVSLGRAGVRVSYAHEAKALSAMVSSSNAAAAQRRRWELGRFAIARRLVGPLLREARTLIALDLAVDLVVPPLSFVALFVLLGCAVFHTLPWIVSAVFLALYVARGWVLSGIGVEALGALARAPFYVLWKLAILLRQHGGEWVRTPREEAPA